MLYYVSVTNFPLSFFFCELNLGVDSKFLKYKVGCKEQVKISIVNSSTIISTKINTSINKPYSVLSDLPRRRIRMLRHLRMRGWREIILQNYMHRSHALQNGVRVLQPCRACVPGVQREVLVLLWTFHLHQTLSGRLQHATGSVPLFGIQRGRRERIE